MLKVFITNNCTYIIHMEFVTRFGNIYSAVAHCHMNDDSISVELC